MKQIVDTIARLADLNPPGLPTLDIPDLPDLEAIGPLATAMSADPTALTRILDTHSDERGTLNTLLGKVGPALSAVTDDLVDIGFTLLRDALPIAASALSFNPVDMASAQVKLNTLATQAFQDAIERLARLEEELLPLAGGFDKIAQASDPQLTTQPQMAASISAEPEPPSGDSGAGEAAVQAALGQLGTPYVWGGTSPGGFDCSGLVQWAYAQAGVSLPRTAEEMAIGQQVTPDQLQPGDLAVWDGHVAMYIGDGQMVEAGDPVQTNPVRTSNIGMGFKGFWRPTA